jgi:hypothetical protein
MNHLRKNQATFLFPLSSSTLCNGQQFFQLLVILLVLAKRKIDLLNWTFKLSGGQSNILSCVQLIWPCFNQCATILPTLLKAES